MTGNLPSDFPPDTFAIRAFCERCGHQANVNHDDIPAGVAVQDLPRLLRCSACGAREATVRIMYIGAGGYRHQG